MTVKSVVVHPLVLLSVTDHHNRVAKDVRGKRVVGVLLGEVSAGQVDITNSFALPFEEDARDGSIFFLDHDYLESMYIMHKKISARERIVGWYSTGPKLRSCDLDVDSLFRRYVGRPVGVIIDTRPELEGLPVQAYQSVDAIVEGRENVRLFQHVPCEVGASEAEEVGVEHLLRDVNDPSMSTLAGEVRAKISGLRGLASRLHELSVYLSDVEGGKLSVSTDILYSVQSMLSSIPNHSTEVISTALFETTNDAHVAMYTASLVRSVLALHDVLSNKGKYREAEAAVEAKEAKSAEEKKEDKSTSSTTAAASSPPAPAK